MPIRVVIADDHPMVLLGIMQQVKAAGSFNVQGAAKNSTELIALLDNHPCDLLITDYAMPGGQYGDGIALLAFVKRRYPTLKIIVMTMMDNPSVLRILLACGINGVVSKADGAEHLNAAAQAAFSGKPYFSPTFEGLAQTLTTDKGSGNRDEELSRRELEVVRLFVAGLTITEIAAQLRRSKQTVSSQKIGAMRKLGIERDADLFKYAMETGLLPSFTSPERP